MIGFLLGALLWAGLAQGSDYVASCAGKVKDKVVYGSATGNVQNVSQTVSAKVKAIFSSSCLKCHGNGTGSGPIKDILDAADLRSIPGMIDTLDPEKSQLYQSIKAGRMPLGGEPLDDAAIEMVRLWIEEGAPDFEDIDPDSGKIGDPFISYDEEVQCVLADLAANVDERTAYYTRYLTLVPHWNAGDGIEIDYVRQALEFALNSVSLKSRKAKPVYVDKHHTIARIDLRDYALDFHDWEQTLLPRYPYAFEPFENHHSFAQEIKIGQITGSARAWLRADWVVSEISQPPVYYEFLKLPKTTQELEEKYLHLRAADQFIEGRVKRAGIRSSGVANNNRFIDLFELEYGLGATQLSGPEFLYTKTYDFFDDVKTSNVLNAPFGPGVFFGSLIMPWLDKQRVFQHAASEIIFTLPNGLNGYYLADGQGKVQRAAPTAVAFDPLNQRPYVGEAPNEVVNGVSCMSCHSAGLNPYADLVRPHVEKSTGFNNAEVKAIRELFPEQDVHNAAIKSFNTAYQDAILEMGMPKVALTRKGMPVWMAVRSYETDNTLVKFGAELYMSQEEVKRAVFHSPKLARELGLTSDGFGVVSRKNLEERFPDILQEFYLGTQVVFKGKGVAKPGKQVLVGKDCQLTIQNKTKHSQRIDSVTYTGGSVGQFWLNPGQSHVVDTNKDAVVKGCAFFKQGNCLVYSVKAVACKPHHFAMGKDGYARLYKD